MSIRTMVSAEVTIRVPSMLEVSEFKKIRYPGKRPCVKTMKKWITNGVIQGEVRGGMYFVDISAEITSTGDDLLNEMLGII